MTQQTGSEWLANCPESPGTDRDNYLLQSAGELVCNFADVTSTIPNHTATFSVCADAPYFLLDDGSRFRPQCCANLAQKIADQLSLIMVTTLIMDIRWAQTGLQVDATILQASSQMSNTIYSKNWNQKLEVKRNGFDGLFADTGKPFILDNKLVFSAGACLYGFFDNSAPYTNQAGQKLWQTVGTKHNHSFSDYSSTMMFMKPTCQVDGSDMSVVDIMQSIELSGLINYDGVLKYTRMP